MDEETAPSTDEVTRRSPDGEVVFVLLCSGRPKSDLVIGTHRKEALREHRREHGRPVPRG